MKIKEFNKAKADPPSPFDEAPGCGGKGKKAQDTCPVCKHFKEAFDTP